MTRTLQRPAMRLLLLKVLHLDLLLLAACRWVAVAINLGIRPPPPAMAMDLVTLNPSSGSSLGDLSRSPLCDLVLGLLGQSHGARAPVSVEIWYRDGKKKMCPVTSYRERIGSIDSTTCELLHRKWGVLGATVATPLPDTSYGNLTRTVGYALVETQRN
jgi:hypothetical protein